MGSTRVSLPESLSIGKPASAHIVSLAQEAMDRGLMPKPLPAEAALSRHGVYVKASIEARILSYLQRCNQSALTLPKAIARLAWAAATSASRNGSSSKSGNRTKAAPPQDPGHFAGRPEQTLFYHRVRDGLEANGIVLGEAGTGVGKGRVIGALASEYGKRTDEGPVIVTAPTVQILGQLLEEYLMVNDPGRPNATFLFGRDQFVCRRALEDWIESSSADPAATKAVSRWIASGAGQAAEGTSRFHGHVPGLSWLVEDLASLSPAIPLNDVRLSSSDPENDDGHKSYLMLREAAHQDARVIFTTHSMLVWHQRIEWSDPKNGLLPEFGTLLVDEAHTLASQAESAHSMSISFRTLARQLDDSAFWKKHHLATLARQVRVDVQSVGQQLCQAAKRLGADSRALYREEVNNVKPMVARLREALGRLGELPNGPPANTVREAIRFSSAILNDNVDVRMTFSPVRGCPSLTGGPASLSFFFRELWNAVPRAALISATIYLPRPSGPPTYGLIKASLHLPSDRLKTPGAVLPDWLFTPTLITPTTRDEQLALTPPQEADYQREIAGYQRAQRAFDAAHKEWLDTVADRVAHAASTAWGGTLVLIPSYDVIEGLDARLGDSLGDRLITQHRGEFRQARNAFIEADRDSRPVWLATGPAWTGLDLSDRDVPPEEDRLLTDLVLPRIPFGLERSSVHQVRTQWMKTAERDRAAFQLRQGIGRLMRRPGVKNRRLWILDGRIWTGKTPWMYSPIKGILARYKSSPPR